jgi:hypothetical protein
VAENLVDTRPILQSDNAGIWEAIERLKRNYYDVITASCLERKALADVYISGPGVYPASVYTELWLQRGTPRETRTSMNIEIHSHPHMRYPVTVIITVTRAGRTKKYAECQAIPASKVAELVSHLFTGGRWPSFSKFRMGGVERWQALILLGLLIPVVQLAVIVYGVYLYVRHLRRRQRPAHISRDYMRSISNLMILAAVVAVFVAISIANAQSEANFAVALSIAAALVVLAAGTRIALSRRDGTVMSSGRPAEDPRFLRIIDNWGALIRGASDAEATFKKRIKTAVDSAPEMKIKAQFETIEYFSRAGKQSREQMVLLRNKVIIFFHCYQFGPDLYVGWDSYLNIVTWLDAPTMKGSMGLFGPPVEFRDVNRVYDSPTEYDLIEHNSLSAWFHERLRSEIEALATERSLSLTLDFDVTKSDRSMALTAAQQQATSPKSRTHIFNLAGLTRRS